jgi:hypothetical protein
MAGDLSPFSFWERGRGEGLEDTHTNGYSKRPHPNPLPTILRLAPDEGTSPEGTT